MKKILSICLIVSILVSTMIFASASSAPTEYCFGYNHPNITYGGWSVTSLNSVGTAGSIHSVWDSNGYYNQYSYSNNNASTCLSVMASSALFYINAHGNSGQVACAYQSGSQWKLQLLTATNTNNDSIAASMSSIFGTNGLSKVKLAYFSACDTANTDTTYGYGNLLEKSVELGVDCAVGFTGEVNTTQLAYFDQRVLCYYGMGNNTISACIVSATQDTFNAYGSYGGVESCAYEGPGSTIKLVPAAYGNP